MKDKNKDYTWVPIHLDPTIIELYKDWRIITRYMDVTVKKKIRIFSLHIEYYSRENIPVIDFERRGYLYGLLPKTPWRNLRKRDFYDVKEHYKKIKEDIGMKKYIKALYSIPRMPEDMVIMTNIT